jgi:hypothetical protein
MACLQHDKCYRIDPDTSGGTDICCYTECERRDSCKQKCKKDCVHNPNIQKGLSYHEEKCLSHLTEAWNEFNLLDPYHPLEKQEFVQALHTLQQLIGMRILNREHPEIFPKKV